MFWLQLVFIWFVIIAQLDTIQNKVLELQEFTTELEPVNFGDDVAFDLSDQACSENIEVSACIENETLALLLHINWADQHDTFISTTEIQSSDGCCQFTSEDNVYESNLTCVQGFSNLNCIYTIFVNSIKTDYEFPGVALPGIQKRCPSQNSVCVMDAEGSDEEFPVKPSDSCPIVSNLSVSSVFQPTTSYISLNVSWTEIKNNNDSNVTIKIGSRRNKTCPYSADIFSYSLHEKYLILPPNGAHPSEEVLPDCIYDVEITQDNKVACNITYRVPECVQTICNCQKFSPRPKVLSVEPTTGKDRETDYFLIKWDPGISTPNGAKYNITEVTFSFSALSTNYGEADWIKTDFNLNQSVVSKKVFKNHNYLITGRFQNNYTCAEDVVFSYTVQASSSSHIVIFIVVTAIVLLVALKRKALSTYAKKLLGVVVPRYNQMVNQRTDCDLIVVHNTNIPMSTNIQYTPVEFIDGFVDEYEFPKNKLIMEKEIGSGAFGTVFLAKAIGIGGIDGYKMVAVKTLGQGEVISREATNDFIAEIEIFKKIGQHPNIVKLLGCCTLEPPYRMIMEFVPCGDLKQYLLDLRKQWGIKKDQQIFFPPDSSDGAYIDPDSLKTPTSITSSRLPSTSETIYTNLDDPMTPLLAQYKQALERVLDHTELQNFALQIAKGMAHLEKIPITHRDLAARNILINEYKVLKISDFGLSRTGPYINQKTNRLPLRWTALEALLTQKYDSKSDVWSFGVVLWEIGTLGAFPYDKVPDSFVQQFLQMGKRLERPEICTDELYDLMKTCWEEEPSDRPTFADLAQLLDVKKKVYVNFSQLNPSYMFPPSEVSLFGQNLISYVDILMDQRGFRNGHVGECEAT